MNQWYRIIFSADDISAAKPLELEGHFKHFFLAAGSPKGATLFKGQEDGRTVYYFSPEAARIGTKIITHLAAAPCPAPAISKVEFVDGDPDFAPV
jgi:hypothetical protein